MKKHIPLIIGNWKMNPTSLGLARKLFIDIRQGIAKKKMNSTVSVAVPSPYLTTLMELSPSKRISLMAQDIFYEEKGTYTGEVSAPILKSVGVSSVLVGHSERRALGDSDEVVGKKTAAALSANLTVVVCVGEPKRDQHGDYFNFVEKQVRSVLSYVPKNKLKLLVFGYEPLWAISKGDGKGKTATFEDAHEMKLFIQKIVSDACGREAVKKVRVLYGGSVNSKNAEEMLEKANVDGFIVGGASLRAAEFIRIVDVANKYGQS